MAAKDYVFLESGFGNVYLAKKTKTPHLMSQDRRLITDNEKIGLFENYLKQWCEENKSDTLVITDENGNKVFTATLNQTENKE